MLYLIAKTPPSLLTCIVELETNSNVDFGSELSVLSHDESIMALSATKHSRKFLIALLNI